MDVEPSTSQPAYAMDKQIIDQLAEVKKWRNAFQKYQHKTANAAEELTRANERLSDLVLHWKNKLVPHENDSSAERNREDSQSDGELSASAPLSFSTSLRARDEPVVVPRVVAAPPTRRVVVEKATRTLERRASPPPRPSTPPRPSPPPPKPSAGSSSSSSSAGGSSIKVEPEGEDDDDAGNGGSETELEDYRPTRKFAITTATSSSSSSSSASSSTSSNSSWSAPPPSSSSTSSSKPAAKPTGLIQSSNKERKMTHLRQSYVTGHTKKLRSLVFNPTTPNLLATCALDGFVKIWNLASAHSSLQEVASVNTTSASKIYPIDMTWSSTGGQCAIVFNNGRAGNQPQLAIVDASKAETAHKLGLVYIKDTPHEGYPNQVRYFPGQSNRLLTGGTDHTVVEWRIDGEVRTRLVHIQHTSQIQSMSIADDILFTGGADRRFVAWNLPQDRLVWEERINEKVNFIEPSPADSNIILIGTTGKSNQLALFDRRIQERVVQLGWTPQTAVSMSQFIHPAWSPCGTLVSSGSTDPTIHMFDVRYARVGKPSFSVAAHELRVLKAVFHPEYSGVLASISSDKKIGLHSLTLS